MVDWNVIAGNSLSYMTTMAPGSADLVFADPPFNVGLEYDVYKDTKTFGEYWQWSKEWVKLVANVVSPSGTFWVMMPDEFAAEMKVIAYTEGFTLRNWCIWYYTFGPHLKSKFGRNKQHLLYFVKDVEDFTFNERAVRIESERQRIGDKRASPDGRVPGDVWEFPRIAGTFKRRTDHPCQMPEEILTRIVLACSNLGDTVFDPFAGSGVTILAAAKHGRKAIGVELSQAYAKSARERIALAMSGVEAI